jgi:hypothetical protein
MADETATSSRVRIELAFKGGHALATAVTPAVADALEQALANGAGGAFELEADDGRYVIPLGNVVYAKRSLRDAPIGFGGPR